MLTQEQKDIIVETMKPLKPTKIGVFGSVARNEETKDSDIDLLYLTNEPIGLFRKIRLKRNLKKKLDKKIDLISFEFISELIKKDVLEDVIVFYDIEEDKN